MPLSKHKASSKQWPLATIVYTNKGRSANIFAAILSLLKPLRRGFCGSICKNSTNCPSFLQKMSFLTKKSSKIKGYAGQFAKIRLIVPHFYKK